MTTFSNAEKIINVAILGKEVNIFIIGRNGMGKTTMMNEVYKLHDINKVKMITGLDYGGLREEITANPQVETIMITDVQAILSRKQDIATSALNYIEMTSEYIPNSEIWNYQKDKRFRVYHSINYIIAGTPHHELRLSRTTFRDWITRQAIIKLDDRIITRDMPYRLSSELPTYQIAIPFDEDAMKIEVEDMIRISGQINPRYVVLISKMYREFRKRGYTKDEAIRLCMEMKFFDENTIEQQRKDMWEVGSYIEK